MIVDGRSIAAEIYRELKNEVSHFSVKPHLTVFTCAPNFETQKYLRLKKCKAEEVGIAINVVEFPDSVSTAELKMSLCHAFMQTDGVIMQLPFPAAIDTADVLQVIPPSLDVDAMQYDGTSEELLPPVVGAIATILERQRISLAGQTVVIVGNGMLVGQPASVWCTQQGAAVTVVTETTADKEARIKSADVLILGAGRPRLITKDMIKPGAIVFDAGTSEDAGVLVGDADPACAEVASVFTPVPGGIGPITIAALLRNVVTLAKAGHGTR